MTAIRIEADTGKINSYTGAVSGMLTAIGNPVSKSRFIGKYMDKTKDMFMVETVAANHAGSQNIRHMFEWGTKGNVSDEPLFRLMKVGRGDSRYLTFDFLPSTKPVPPPIGITDPNVLNQLRPHIFRMKAMVMETMEHVTIEPRSARGLFIPAADQPRGYLMTPHAVTINPGGNSTGGFAKWWAEWFDTRAQELINAQTKLTEEFIAKTGQTVIRDAAGRFSTGMKASFGYAEAAARTAELQMQTMISMEYGNG